ncbi:MAG: gliding motility protein GldM [Saprospiraceae bacterium]|nr:gliding motility protein GldM [Saprospiraceae bacterium]
MAFPKDLRQRMINLMYLVLMAMLAINIDPAALKAFDQINRGMVFAGEAFDAKNDNTLEAIKVKSEKEGGFAVDYYNRAQKAASASQNLQDYIDGIIASVREQATNEKGEYNRDDKDPAALFLGDTIGEGEAYKLKDKITATLDSLIASVDGAEFFKPEEIEEIRNSLPLGIDEDSFQDSELNPEGYEWERFTFKGKPAVALEAILRQYKNDAKTAEGQIIDEFRSRLDIAKIDFDVYQAAVIPKSTYIRQGEPFSADIFLAASSSKSKGLVQITAGGRGLAVDSEGKATYSATNGVGEHSFSGTIRVTNPNTGKVSDVPFGPVKYQVAAPSGNVSADKMNVFYIGVPNPVTVSAAGVPLQDVTASCSGCTMKKTGPGKYTVTATKQGKANVTVTAQGKTQATKEFRIKRIPDPTPKIGTFKSGTPVSTGQMAAQTFLQAELENFDFDARFKVKSYDIWLISPGKSSFRSRGSGSQLPADIKSNLRKIGPGWSVLATNIIATGPDGSTRNLGSIYYPIK